MFHLWFVARSFIFSVLLLLAWFLFVSPLLRRFPCHFFMAAKHATKAYTHTHTQSKIKPTLVLNTWCYHLQVPVALPSFFLNISVGFFFVLSSFCFGKCVLARLTSVTLTQNKKKIQLLFFSSQNKLSSHTQHYHCMWNMPLNHQRRNEPKTSSDQRWESV